MLTKEQKIILDQVFESNIAEISSWGGGTALAEIYLHQRKSEDIDIILTDLPPLSELTLLTNRIKKALSAKSKQSQVKLNRFQYTFRRPGGEQKLEFIYYPFKKLAKGRKNGKIKIESLLDIAAAKTLAAYQRQEVKDAYDLYLILNQKLFDLDRLARSVEEKFEEKIDPPTLLAKMVASLQQFNLLQPLLADKKISKQKIADFFQKLFDQYMRKIKF